MLILRMKTDEMVTTFTFQTKEGLEKATKYVKRTSAAGFTAETDSPDSTHGKILEKWDHKHHLYGDRYVRDSSYSIKYGAYKDTEDGYLGTEEWCMRKCEEVNKDYDGWWCRRAHMEHIVGPLWVCVVVDPYLD